MTTSADAIKDVARRDPVGTYERLGVPLTVKGNRGWASCPLHHETKPSFAVALGGDAAGLWKCFGSCACGGSIIDLYSKLHHVHDVSTVCSELGRILAIEPGAVVSRPLSRPQPVQATPPPVLPVPLDAVDEAHAALLARPDLLAWLLTNKAVTEHAVKQFRLGVGTSPHLRAGWGKARFTIPIPDIDQDGAFADLRGYRPNPPDGTAKILPWSTGRGAMLFPRGIAQGQMVYLWTEGEIDCINAVSRGFAALTCTCGALGWRSPHFRWPDLAGRTFLVCGDNDDAGRELNRLLPPVLLAHGAGAVAVFEWDEGLPEGYDLTDYLIGGGAVEEVLATCPPL